MLDLEWPQIETLYKHWQECAKIHNENKNTFVLIHSNIYKQYRSSFVQQTNINLDIFGSSDLSMHSPIDTNGLG